MHAHDADDDVEQQLFNSNYAWSTMLQGKQAYMEFTWKGANTLAKSG